MKKYIKSAMTVSRVRAAYMMTQEQFGNIVGATLKTISSWECGKTYPRFRHQINIVQIAASKNIVITFEDFENNKD